MAFVQATDNNDEIVHISAEHIMAVRTDGEGTLVTMAVTGSNGVYFFYLQEPVTDILSRVEIALAYRRGR